MEINFKSEDSKEGAMVSVKTNGVLLEELKSLAAEADYPQLEVRFSGRWLFDKLSRGLYFFAVCITISILVVIFKIKNMRGVIGILIFVAIVVVCIAVAKIIDRNINKWNIASGQEPWQTWIENHSTNPKSLGSAARGLKQYLQRGGLKVAIESPIKDAICCQISTDNNSIVSGHKSGVLIFRKLKGTVVSESLSVKASQGPVLSCAIAPDASFIMTGSEDGTVALWNLSDNELRCITSYQAHDKPVWSCKISPRSDFLVSTGGDGTVKIWSKKGQELATLTGHNGNVYACTIYADGSKIISGGDDGTVRIWDVLTKTEQCNFTAHDQVRDCAISADGTRLAVADLSGTITVWNPIEKTREAIFTNQKQITIACDISRDGKYVLTGGAYGVLRFYNIDENKLVSKFATKSWIFDCVISDDGKFFILASGTVNIWLSPKLEKRY